MLSTKFQVNWSFGSGLKQKIDFQDGHHGSHLGFMTGTILANFDLQVTMMLPTKFQVNWPFGSRREAKNRFSRWPPCHLGFRITTILAIFDLQVTSMLPTKFRVNWFFGSKEARNKISRWLPQQPSWISDQNDFTYF